LEDSQEQMDLAMAETLHIKGVESLISNIKQVSHKHFKREICGFIGFDTDQMKFVLQHEENVSPDPASYFLINPLNYLLFKENYEMVAIFHSHIMGDEEPSEFDIKMADNCCQPFLIYSLNTKKINIYQPKNVEANVNILERIKGSI